MREFTGPDVHTQRISTIVLYVLPIQTTSKHLALTYYVLCITTAPESSPTEITFDNGNPYNISVEWRPPRVPNGVITHYTLYVGFEDGSVDVFYVNGESTSYNITNLQPYQIISVEISASTSVGEGPRSYKMEVQTAQAGKI